MADDLYDELNVSLMWINIRTRLVGYLSELANTGDRSAQDQLNFLVQYWSTPVPMQKQLAQTQQRTYQLGGVAMTLLELLERQGVLLPHLADQCRKLGIDYPQSVTRSRTITTERCGNCLSTIVFPNEHLTRSGQYNCVKV